MLNEKQSKETPNNPGPDADPGQPMVYQIRVRSQLGADWTDWFEGLTITLDGNGDTLMTGPVKDQAALHGLIKKVRDLGMALVSVNPIQFDDTSLEEGCRK